MTFIMTDAYRASHDWERMARHVVKPRQIILVIGAIDVGKSTFCRFLVEQGVANGLKVGFVDADVGQSLVGPTTTIGLKMFPPQSGEGGKIPPLKQWREPDDFYFVGWTSPNNHLLQCVTGARLMVDAAREAGADLIVIDTTGYVEGGPAVALKLHKIEVLKPTHLIGIHRSRELEPILSCFDQLDAVEVHRLSPHKDVVSKTPGFRRKYRELSFEQYFSGCVQETLPFDQIRSQRTPFFTGRRANAKELDILSDFVDDRVVYAEWGNKSLTLVTLEPLSNLVCARLKGHLSLMGVIAETPAYFERRFVGLLNAAGKAIAVGVIEAVDFNAGCLKIRCKPGAGQAAKVVQFGQYRDTVNADADFPNPPH
jgi:polynucleotide 5'-hydroxyl-kinase GRC3/NOL9